MTEENNELPEVKSGLSKNTLVIAFIVLVVMVIIWAFATGKLSPGGLG